jgi:hypothetical protein
MEGPAQTPPQVAVVKHRVQKPIFLRRNQASMLVTATLWQSKIPPSDPVPQLRAAHSQSAPAATKHGTRAKLLRLNFMPASLELGAGEPTTLKPTTPVEVGLSSCRGRIDVRQHWNPDLLHRAS